MKKSFLFFNVLFVIMACFAQEVPSSVTFSYCFPTESDTYLTVGCDLPYMWNAQSCVETGTYTYLTINSRGCDSVARLHLTVTNWVNNVTKPDTTMCPADLPYIWRSTKADQNEVYNYTCNAVGNYQRTFTNIHGCDSVVSFTINEATGCRPIGSARGLFSVSASQQVYFAMGNLQYKASQNGTAGDITHTVAGNTTKPGVFRFAEHQYDWVGNNTASTGNVYENNVKCSNELASSTYTGWIDMFGFGTSGYNNKYPYWTSTGNSYFNDNLTGSYANYDWGVYNSISNGGDEPGLWRTLTNTEWTYLMDTRTGAANKKGWAMVNDVHGLIILPDVWTLPDGISTFVPFNYSTASYSNNVYYTANHASYVDGVTNSWDVMEAAGAVFLPACGYRYTSFSSISNSTGYYYSSTYGGSSRYAYYMGFYYNPNSGYYYINVEGGVNQRDYGASGLSVRLVQNYVP